MCQTLRWVHILSLILSAQAHFAGEEGTGETQSLVTLSQVTGQARGPIWREAWTSVA